MTDAQTLLALAERCEKATGSDRSLDGLIQQAIGRDHPVHYSGVGVCNAFTASLDAALTLVPDGWFYKIEATWCTVWPTGNIPDDRWTPAMEIWDDDGQSHGRTPALALCAAALRARAAILGDAA